MSISIADQKQNIIVEPKALQTNWSWKKAIILGGQTVGALIVCILLLEGYFRLSGVGGQEFIQPDLDMGCRHIANKKVIWRLEGYSNDTLSKVGLRDTEHNVAKPDGTYRIALLGDSAVESLQVSMNETFGKVLETLLNEQAQKIAGRTINQFEVINFGCSSYSTGQELLQYEQEVDKYNPDAVVLLYNRGDSLENVVKAKDRKRAEARPYFFVDNEGHLQQDNSILIANKNKLQINTVKDFLRRHSAVFGVLNQADFSLSLNEPRYRKVKSWWQSLLNLPNRFANKSQKIAAPYVDQNDMAVTKELLVKLAKEVQGKKREFILAVFPNTINYAELTQQAKELKLLAATNNFSYLDLSKSFLACSDPSSNFIQYHFSKKGHAVVAYDLFNIISNKLKQ